MGTITVAGLDTGQTNLNLTAGDATATVPVTVLEPPNLMPAITTIWREDNGINYAITDDGTSFTAKGGIGEKRDYSLVPLGTIILTAGTYTLAKTRFDGAGFTTASLVQLANVTNANSNRTSFNVPKDGEYTIQFVTRDPTVDGTVTPMLTISTTTPAADETSEEDPFA
ncbi:hypothetical protein [Bifidobacterium miconisargentati]|uniref:hypothetical protein n=1 Tax=Bifidobacterium miconisargentati TaxID=2834437 RepID=UPI001BDC2C8A|nr:hypothetical protein [Bifidobacterium miconisargentati]MBW3090438.1 hypothetical protein [Bifidobacterium miconisargentati]